MRTGSKYTYGSKQGGSHKLIYLVVGLTLVGGSLLAANYKYGIGHSSSPNLIETSKPNKTVPHLAAAVGTNYGLPVRLQIPKLRVDAHVIYVGLTKDGNMNVPTNIIDTGWYKYGALPGNTGTAVIAGHLDGFGGKPGVFSDLYKLVAGDAISVSETNGLIVTFIVRESRSYPQNEQATEVFSSNSGAHLNLITCTGSWDSADHRFAKRLVVFADKQT